MSRKLAFLMFFAFVTAVACGGHAEDTNQETARPTNTQTATIRPSATFTAAPLALPPTDTVEPTFTLAHPRNGDIAIYAVASPSPTNRTTSECL